MAGYLDTYGVADERRERIVKWSLIIGISTLLLAVIGYYTFRTHAQERVMAQFLEDLQHQQYMDAYKLWGCPQNCRLYPPDEFLKDSGPDSKMAKASRSRSSTSTIAVMAWCLTCPIRIRTTLGCGSTAAPTSSAFTPPTRLAAPVRTCRSARF